MISKEEIAKLGIVSYPAPILRRKCKPVEVFDERLEALAAKMLSLMHAHRGVGLAGPQVGLPLRIFVWNPTGEPGDDQVCVNPVLDHMEGELEAEEGCLSIEGVTVKIARARSAEIEARDVRGEMIRLQGEDLAARIWQHETDHLDGRLILDYMSPAEEITNRKALRELEAKAGKPRKKSRSRSGRSR